MCTQVIELLIIEGATLLLQDGETALIVAVKGRRVDEVEVLVESGADLDIKEEVTVSIEVTISAKYELNALCSIV